MTFSCVDWRFQVKNVYLDLSGLVAAVWSDRKNLNVCFS